LNELVGGGAIVFLSARYSARSLIVLSYLWGLIICVLLYVLLYYIDLVPEEYILHTVVLGFLMSVTGVNTKVLLGKEKINAFNIVFIIQALTILITVSFVYFILNAVSVTDYIVSLYVSYILTVIISAIYTLPYFKEKRKSSPGILKEMIKLGLMSQVAQISQFFNYRFAFYLVKRLMSMTDIGIFSLGTQLSESTWLVSKSVALVEYSKVANSKDKMYSKKITIAFIQLMVIVTGLLLAVLLIIPSDLYILIFGEEFSGIKKILCYLSPGIFLWSTTIIISRYFSGLGKIHINTITSLIGLVVTVSLGFYLINDYQLKGAAILNSLSYTLATVFIICCFVKDTRLKWKDLIINKSMINTILKETVSIFRPGKPNDSKSSIDEF
jgi:O-antigen/teichoic acid export membrane protein